MLADDCAYSSSSAGMRPARNRTTGSSSKSPSSASPVRDQAAHSMGVDPAICLAPRSPHAQHTRGGDLPIYIAGNSLFQNGNREIFQRRFKSEVQQVSIDGMAE